MLVTTKIRVGSGICFPIQRQLQMSLYTCVAFQRTAIVLGTTKYKMALLHELLQHPPYNNFYKTAIFLHVNNVIEIAIIIFIDKSF